MNENNFIREEAFNDNMRRIDSRFSNIENRLGGIEGEIKAINARIEGITDTVAVAINGINSRIDDMRDNQAQGLTKWGIIVAVVVGLVQVAVALFMK